MMSKAKAVQMGLRRVEENINEGYFKSPQSVLDYLKGYFGVELKEAEEEDRREANETANS